MINETMYGLGNAPSAIRELFAYGLERKAEIGEDKVFDFSIGNPSVPAPDKVAKTMHELADMPPAQLHAYSPASGLDETKTAIAGNLNRRFGTDYTAKNFYLTTGANMVLEYNPGNTGIVQNVNPVTGVVTTGATWRTAAAVSSSGYFATDGFAVRLRASTANAGSTLLACVK